MALMTDQHQQQHQQQQHPVSGATTSTVPTVWPSASQTTLVCLSFNCYRHAHLISSCLISTLNPLSLVSLRTSHFSMKMLPKPIHHRPRLLHHISWRFFHLLFSLFPPLSLSVSVSVSLLSEGLN